MDSWLHGSPSALNGKRLFRLGLAANYGIDEHGVRASMDCYRFQLSNPSVDLAVMGPASEAQMNENLDGLAKGPLTSDEEKWMREFGRAVHG